MIAKSIYARLQIELYKDVKSHAEASGQSISSAVEELVRKGIAAVSSEEPVKALQERAQTLEKERAELRGANEALKSQLEACKAKESIALAAQRHVAEMEEQTKHLQNENLQLRQYLLTPVMVCKNCRTQFRLVDVGRRQCPACGKWSPEWLADYKPPAATWEIVRDGAAVVGGVAIVAALLNAISTGQDSSSGKS